MPDFFRRSNRQAPPDPDAALAALFARWRTSADHCDRTRDAVDQAEERHLPLAVPEALYCRHDDWRHFGREVVAYPVGPGGRPWYGHSDDQAWLHRFDGWRRDGLRSWLDPVAKARRDEIVQAHDRWRDEIDKAAIREGLPDIRAEHDAAERANRSIRRGIILAEARSLDGVLLKAHVMLWCGGPVADITEILEDMVVARNDVSSDAVAWSMARDLTAIVEREGAR